MFYMHLHIRCKYIHKLCKVPLRSKNLHILSRKQFGNVCEISICQTLVPEINIK